MSATLLRFDPEVKRLAQFAKHYERLQAGTPASLPLRVKFAAKKREAWAQTIAAARWER